MRDTVLRHLLQPNDEPHHAEGSPQATRASLISMLVDELGLHFKIGLMTMAHATEAILRLDEIAELRHKACYPSGDQDDPSEDPMEKYHEAFEKLVPWIRERMDFRNF